MRDCLSGLVKILCDRDTQKHEKYYGENLLDIFDPIIVGIELAKLADCLLLELVQLFSVPLLCLNTVIV